MACHIIRGSLIEYRQIRARVNIARSQLELILNKVNVAGLKREKTGVTRLNISLVGSVVRVLLTNHNAQSSKTKIVPDRFRHSVEKLFHESVISAKLAFRKFFLTCFVVSW